MFLHNNPQHKTTADMVRIRKSTKSHVSASLQTLERKGLILRTQSAANKRRIEIVLLRARSANCGGRNQRAKSVCTAYFKRANRREKAALQGCIPKNLQQCRAVFAVTGIGVILLYAHSGNTYGYHMTRMVAAILISFGCYLP